MSYHVLDPTSEVQPVEVSVAPRLSSLAGITVGFISTGKEGTKGFFKHLEQMLRDDFGVGDVVFRQKSNYSAPAETSIIKEAEHWDVAITGIGD